jgi:hypothetical protein
MSEKNQLRDIKAGVAVVSGGQLTRYLGLRISGRQPNGSPLSSDVVMALDDLALVIADAAFGARPNMTVADER